LRSSFTYDFIPVLRKIPKPDLAGEEPDSTEESFARYLLRSGERKSNIPCLPGLTPVWNDDQATGDIPGLVVPSLENVPSSRSFWRLGSSPSFIIFSAIKGDKPSRPSIITLFAVLRYSLLFLLSNLSANETGQISAERKETKIALRNTRKDVTIPKPAPGPT